VGYRLILQAFIFRISDVHRKVCDVGLKVEGLALRLIVLG
jgi:hypothetical protein